MVNLKTTLLPMDIAVSMLYQRVTTVLTSCQKYLEMQKNCIVQLEKEKMMVMQMQMLMMRIVKMLLKLQMMLQPVNLQEMSVLGKSTMRMKIWSMMMLMARLRVNVKQRVPMPILVWGMCP
ncbi:hypothetical protein LINPERPRIM_LOCUS32319 [Linum perenne]